MIIHAYIDSFIRMHEISWNKEFTDVNIRRNALKGYVSQIFLLQGVCLYHEVVSGK